MKRNQYGQTWYQWARELFEDQNCDECGKGVRGHEPAILLGNWFARCKGVGRGEVCSGVLAECMSCGECQK